MSTALRHLPDVRPEYIALGFLEKDSLHGYDLYRRFEADLGKVWHISQSQMYSILKRLEAQALVEGWAESGNRNQAKRRLAMTEPGRRRFLECCLGCLAIPWGPRQPSNADCSTLSSSMTLPLILSRKG